MCDIVERSTRDTEPSSRHLGVFLVYGCTRTSPRGVFGHLLAMYNQNEDGQVGLLSL